MQDITIAIITGIFTFAGVIVTVVYGNKKTEKCLTEQSQLTLYRIDELEKKQDKHNSVIERMYHAEERLEVLEERQKVANHRLEDLEKKVG